LVALKYRSCQVAASKYIRHTNSAFKNSEQTRFDSLWVEEDLRVCV